MLDLNFLSVKEQRTVSRNLTWLVMRNSFMWLALITALVVLLLLWSKVALETNLAQVQERSILVTGSKLSFASQIDQINTTIDEVESLQDKYFTWSLILLELTELVPPGNQVSELSINATDQTFSLSGFSKTRSDLLALETNLLKTDLITKLNSPVSNLLKPTDIQFTFSGSILLHEEPADTDQQSDND